MHTQAEIDPAIAQAEKWMAQHKVPVVIEIMLERITNIAMGTEIDKIVLAGTSTNTTVTAGAGKSGSGSTGGGCQRTGSIGGLRGFVDTPPTVPRGARACGWPRSTPRAGCRGSHTRRL